MTYNVFSWTLNPTQSINQSICLQTVFTSALTNHGQQHPRKNDHILHNITVSFHTYLIMTLQKSLAPTYSTAIFQKYVT